MSTPVIIDIVVIAVLLGFTIYGAARGLFRALAGLLVVIVALVGAGIIAGAVSAPAAKLVAPWLEKRIEFKVDDAMAVQSEKAQMPEADVEDGLSAEDLLGLLGLDSDTVDSLADRARDAVRDTGVSIATAVVESVAGSILYALIYIVSFLILMAVLMLLVHLVDQVLKLPGLHGLNAVGGGLAGFVEGALLLFLAIWAARHLGISFETETVSATHVLRFFTTNTPLSALSFLQ